jgi:hypothetical protein
MLKRILGIACVLALGIGLAWAGDATKPATTTAPSKSASSSASSMGAEHMQAMKAEMMKCAVCKNMAVNMDELGPVMRMDVAKLNDGCAIVHSVTDPSKAAKFHATCDAMYKAGETAKTMTDEQAKTQLCSFCQEMRSTMKAGAKLSHGNTEMGDVMVLTSSDPVVAARIDGIATQCQMMAASMKAGAKAEQQAKR